MNYQPRFEKGERLRVVTWREEDEAAASVDDARTNIQIYFALNCFQYLR